MGVAPHVVLGEVQHLEHAGPTRLAGHGVGVEAVHLVAVGDGLEEALEAGDEVRARVCELGAVEGGAQGPVADEGLGRSRDHDGSYAALVSHEAR